MKFIFKIGKSKYVHIEHESRQAAINTFKSLYPRMPVKIVASEIIIKK